MVNAGIWSKTPRGVLQQRGCDEVQGYLISPAISADEFSERFGSGRGVFDAHKLSHKSSSKRIAQAGSMR